MITRRRFMRRSFASSDISDLGLRGRSPADNSRSDGRRQSRFVRDFFDVLSPTDLLAGLVFVDRRERDHVAGQTVAEGGPIRGRWERLGGQPWLHVRSASHVGHLTGARPRAVHLG